MLYPRKNEPLTAELFANPGSEYRATPFWAWNSMLDKNDLLWQIEQFKKMGFGGFHMHVRTGLGIDYLSDTYMDIIKACIQKAEAENMLAWLYDEDRWPSGAAGGLVTKNSAYRQCFLVLTQSPKAGEAIACFDVQLNADGTLFEYERISADAKPKGFKLYAYQEIAEDDPWYNNQAYLNTLDPASVQAFIQTTHERYNETVSDSFGKSVPAIFTDEPQFSRKQTLRYAMDTAPVTLPWTHNLEETFQAAYGRSLTEALPELLWELPEGRVSEIRYCYHDHVAERFASAFADQCGRWCDAHGIMLTGHMMEEPTLESQTAALGDAMRSYRSFQLPGIDMLCDRREFTTAKQAQSASRQYGREGVLSELYGVTNWNFDFRGHKLQGDWQAALGVTVRVPHLSWVSMNGEAKRDYPGTFNYQAPWYQEYGYIEDHFARVNTAMTRGKPICRIGVIHPVESYWLHWGASENTQAIRDELEEQFMGLTNWLISGLMDFDFISEALLPKQCPLETIASAEFPVGEMRYEAILVPPMETMRADTLIRLKQFRARGGTVIFAGDPPRYIDVKESDEAERLCAQCISVPFRAGSILSALEELREIEIRDENGGQVHNLVYQLREEADARWLFLAHSDTPRDPDIPEGQLLKIKIKGRWDVTRYETLTAEILPQAVDYENGWTVVQMASYAHDAFLFRLTESTSAAGMHAKPDAVKCMEDEGDIRFFHKVPVTLHEPNVLLLDIAEYALDDEAYQPAEEILRLDNILRKRLGWPLRGKAFAQPWVEPDRSTPNMLRLRYTFYSEVEIANCCLALENASISTVTLNGAPAGAVKGWYVDKCMETVPLPEIQLGQNVLELTIPYGKKVHIEACYLLGGFGVRVEGVQSTLTKAVTSLAFGDITGQGLPFYGGNITYHVDFSVPAGDYEIAVTQYRGQFIAARIDEKAAGKIVFSPYRLQTGRLEAGSHRLDLTLYGNRINTFGQLHHANHTHDWWGPDSWRTKGSAWRYEYQPWVQGILKSPEILARRDNG